MNERFSKKFLFEIRNQIPVDVLISQGLRIPHKTREGYFRFLCPVCREFNTATDPRTNLARCFLCERNFNTIEIVKECNQLDFVRAVLYLDKFRTSLSKNTRKMQQVPSESSKRDNPVSIGSILREIKPAQETAPSDCTNEKPEPVIDLEIMNRITRIEYQLGILIERIQTIEKKMC